MLRVCLIMNSFFVSSFTYPGTTTVNVSDAALLMRLKAKQECQPLASDVGWSLINAYIRQKTYEMNFFGGVVDYYW